MSDLLSCPAASRKPMILRPCPEDTIPLKFGASLLRNWVMFAAIAIGIVLFSSREANAQAKSPEPAKGNTAKDSKVVVRLVRLGEKGIPWPFLLLQMSSAGTFLGADGERIPPEALPSLYRDRDKKEQVVIVVDLVDEKDTSLQTVLEAVEKIKAAAPPDQEALIVVRYSGKPKKDKDK